MAGLSEYLGMGFGIAALYIGVKYGGQIINNLKGTQVGPAPSSQTPPDQTSTAPSSQTPSSQGDNLDEIGQPVYNIPGAPRHQNDTGTYRPPPSSHPAITSGPIKETTGTNPFYPAVSHVVPSGTVKEAPTNVRKGPHIMRKHTRIHRHQHPDTTNCLCDTNGVWKAYPGQHCAVAGEKCTPTASAYLGYFDGYEIPVTGPQWRQTIPNRELVASQGMATSRIKRALAAGNHDFMPGGFVLSEASVRRGVNNVYTAGT